MPPTSTSSGPTPPPSSAPPGAGAPPTSRENSAPGGGSNPSGAPPSSGPVGPDGFDESSQQSTLSQSSDRSDGRQTPKQATPQHSGQGPQHPHNFMGNFSHHGPPGSPHSSAPSPGGSMGSSGAGPEGGYPRDGMASPSWQRPPVSPVSTPQVCKSRKILCSLFISTKNVFHKTLLLFIFDVTSRVFMNFVFWTDFLVLGDFYIRLWYNLPNFHQIASHFNCQLVVQ